MKLPIQASYLYYGLNPKSDSVVPLISHLSDIGQPVGSPRGPKVLVDISNSDVKYALLSCLQRAFRVYHSKGRARRAKRISQLYHMISTEYAEDAVLRHQSKTSNDFEAQYSPEVKEAVLNEIAYAVSRVKMCWSDFVPDEFWERMVVKKSYSETRKRSWGGMRDGVPFISLALYNHVPMKDEPDAWCPFFDRQVAMYRFMEYSNLRHTPYMTTVWSKDWRIPLRALIMHEMAHAIQWWWKSYGGQPSFLSKEDLQAPHGYGFQEIYSNIRRDNHLK